MLKRIAIVVGGTQSEHSATLQSGQDVANALKERIPSVDSEILCLWNISDRIRIEEERWDAAILLDSTSDTPDLPIALRKRLRASQTRLIGADEEIFLLLRDKVRAKNAATHLNVMVPAGIDSTQLDWESTFDLLEEPIIVKPRYGASSLGIAWHTDKLAAKAEVRQRSASGEFLIAESAVKGIEVTVPVIRSNGELRVLAPAEIEPIEAPYYDYRAKYITQSNNLYIPARLNAVADGEVRRLSHLFAQHLSGAFSLIRIDWIISERGPVFIEANAEPLLCSTDFVARSARHDNISFSQLINGLVSSIL